MGTNRHRQALLVNTLYSLSARHIELRHAEGLPADVAQVRGPTSRSTCFVENNTPPRLARYGLPCDRPQNLPYLCTYNHPNFPSTALYHHQKLNH